MTTTFSYSSLLPREIRLLTLQPGIHGNPLIGYLEPAQFVPQAKIIPVFEALSYTWGDQSSPDQITIYDGSCKVKNDADAKRSMGVVAIGRNLAAALRQLRYQDIPRVLWCDSICINQNDLSERASQVLLMGDIYTHTQRVIVWLGQEADDSHLAMNTLRVTASQLDLTDNELDAATNMISLKEDANPAFRGRETEIPFTTDEWTAISKLIARSWFKRLWIRQEITLADSTALVLVGADEMLWTHFLGAAALIRSKERLPISIESRRDLTNLSSFRRMKVFRSLHSSIDYTQQSQCTDDRDRVYALLGTIPTELAETIRPDYTQDVKQVYRTMFLKAIEFYTSLNLLEYCNLAIEPTWVPDLNRLQKNVGHFEHTWAAAESEAAISVLDAKRIAVHGIRCDKIKREIGHVPMECSEEQLKAVVRAALSQYLGSNSHLWDQTKLEVVTQSLLGGRCYEISEWISYPRLGRSASVIQRWATCSSEQTSNSVDEEKVLAALFEILPGRSFYETSHGAFLVGPSGSCERDFVYVLLGCRTTMIFRPVPRINNSPIEYHVIGPAYHPSFSSGEALCGPFADGWRMVLEVGGLGPVFKKEGALWQKQDPRMEGIEKPEGWCEGEDEDGWPYWYEEIKGDDEVVWKDPRLNLIEIQGRGVSIEKVILR